jgi:catechol 2,3-dioxygenase-like lactoylglutathione lyase family enzyme
VVTREVSSMQVQRISWLGTRTEQFEATKAFFANVLGLPVVHEEPGFAAFQLPTGEHDLVEVFGVDDPEVAFMTTGPVPGFHVADVANARRELEEAGIEMLEPISWLRDYDGFEDATDYAWFSFRGPDGNAYACIQGSRPRSN